MLRSLWRVAEEPLRKGFHSSSALSKQTDEFGLRIPAKFIKRNEIVHPPEKPVTPYIVHYRSQVQYSLKKMLPITWKIRGLSIDDAIAQMEFDVRKGAKSLKEVLQEAKELAVTKHNIEFGSNLWVSESFVTKGEYFEGVRKHARGRYGSIEYRYCHIFVCLEEGKPPEHYYKPPLTPEEKLALFKKELDDRYVMYSI